MIVGQQQLRARVAGVKSVEVLTEQFRARGLKVTPQRQSIFRALSSSTVHPTAESVYAAVSAEMPTISLRTVYQTLNDLAAMGELSTLDLGTGSTRFDPNLEPHHHLVCDVCGRIDDLDVDFPSVVVPSTGESAGFEVTATEIVFRGRCARCASQPEAGAKRRPEAPAAVQPEAGAKRRPEAPATSAAPRSHQPNTGEQNA
jgi:Fe2+ or Zn2+ uptake regulation protein